MDLQPIVAKITIKDKVFQFVLPEEICTDKSTAQRSQTTGHLVIKMPIAGYKPMLRRNSNAKELKAEQRYVYHAKSRMVGEYASRVLPGSAELYIHRYNCVIFHSL